MPSPCHSEHDATGSPRSTTDTPDRLTSAPLYYRCAAAPMVRMGSPGPHRGHTRPEWHGQHRAMAATQHRSSAALLNQHHRSSDPLDSLSHGGSQGFKSPHLHPTSALVTGLAGRFRRAGAVPGSPSGQQTGSNRERNGQPLLDCGQRTERSGHVPDLPITRRMLGVDLVGSRRIEPAHVEGLVDPDRSRRIQEGSSG
jgi:hypothetical protein